MNRWLDLERPGLPRIAYRSDGDGAPVVLVHGVGGDSSNWDDVIERLSPPVRAIRLDLRGHGRSGPISAPCRIEDFARDVTDVMDALDVGACRLVGFSLGGAVALCVALDSPARVQKLAVISTVTGRTEAERTNAQKRVEVLKEKGLADIAAGNRDRWFTDEFQKAHPEKVEARVKQLLQSDPASYLHAFTVFATTDFAARLGEIRMPTLVITGENDVAATPRMARLMHERIAGSGLHVLPRVRHSLLIESPDPIAGLLAGFF